MCAIFVLTGGPCAGKSTLLAELERRGYPVIGEAAAEVILEGRFHPSLDPLEFQREVLRRQVLRELAAPPVTVFADRAIGDHFGYLEYYRSRGCPDLLVGDFARELARAWEEAAPRYRAVFLLEQGPEFVESSYRRESREEAALIHRALARAYRERHGRVIDLAWAPLADRVEAVLAVAAQEPRSAASDSRN